MREISIIRKVGEVRWREKTGKISGFGTKHYSDISLRSTFSHYSQALLT